MIQAVQMDAWTSDAHPWDLMNPALPKFEKYLRLEVVGANAL